mmetsp:Transcript_39004/g.110630  ORF Transcript_39004/g.110630 Transcript_39004/m.110630 type:complete len:204 (+) Transcript_39004:573-1184(+)
MWAWSMQYIGSTWKPNKLMPSHSRKTCFSPFLPCSSTTLTVWTPSQAGSCNCTVSQISRSISAMKRLWGQSLYRCEMMMVITSPFNFDVQTKFRAKTASRTKASASANSASTTVLSFALPSDLLDLPILLPLATISSPASSSSRSSSASSFGALAAASSFSSISQSSGSSSSFSPSSLLYIPEDSSMESPPSLSSPSSSIFSS